jgi:hypothetical protein
VDAKSLLDREYLEMRSRLISLAASMDRIDRGAGREGIGGDPRMSLLSRAIELLGDGRAGRAERLQRLFSDDYQENWRADFGLNTTRKETKAS